MRLALPACLAFISLVPYELARDTGGMGFISLVSLYEYAKNGLWRDPSAYQGLINTVFPVSILPEKKIKIENNNFCPCGTEVGILRSGLLRSGQEF